jgi:hypothetical protein
MDFLCLTGAGFSEKERNAATREKNERISFWSLDY